LRDVLDLLTDLVGAAQARGVHAEARHVARTQERLLVRDGRVDRVDSATTEGVGVRVRANGAWEFAATADVSRAGAEGALAGALALARALPSTGEASLAGLDAPARGHWASPCGRDPFAVSLEDKLELLLGTEALLRGDARIARTEASCLSTRTAAAFASTDGAACTQTVVECGGGLQAWAVGDGDLQVRSYPSAHGGSVAQAGWEHLLALDLAGNAPRVAEEAVALLSAPPCPSGPTTLILGSEQLALQVHESIGHALELDRILLGEASYAGTSWVQAEDLGSLRYGSEHLHITADGTATGGLGTYGWDDEGVAAGRTPLIEAGVLRAALSDRQSAAAVGLARSAGCARADGFARQPIVRMTNVSIEPGDAGTLEDLIADTEDGVYLETNRSWSIDDRRLHFQFATEIAHEIRDGRLDRLLRDPSYAGVTPRFWGGLDAVCSPQAWSLHGLLNCGKGEPGQVMRVSHGAAPARFRDVEVGVA
jgi:TldD protein